ncbi:MAG TPA: prepilin-type N-terminal cleavage/methylation domain-containing protein [Candidatus Eisenbacteria bacterium]|nr:prepilin-type N-terminal cleavage/methylation domain-containing protein [Candidatus Eisenbacteria bacterium]
MPSFLFRQRPGSREEHGARRSKLEARPGFTLPELLVVISIIGMISTIGVVSYSSVRASARDVKRASDMKQLQTAIELFFENNNFYPGDGKAGSEGVILGTETTKTLSDSGFTPSLKGTPYMVAVPRNPEPFGSPYVYRSLNADGTDCNTATCASYAILFTLEKVQGNYQPGPHAMTPAGIAGAEGGYAGEGITGAGQQIVGIEAVQAQLDVLATRATLDVQRVIDDKRVETVTEAAIAPTVATVAVANTALTTSSAASYLALFLTQPFVLLGRKKRKAWGTVYNSLSHLPVDLVIVRLRDAGTGKIVKSTVTDLQGRYSFLAHRGAYRIEASKVGFRFPSQVTAGKKEDGPFIDLYHGEIIEVGQEGAILTPNVPFDPESSEASDAVVLKKERLHKFNRAVAILSPTLGGITLLIKPSLFVGLLFAAQIVIYFLFRRLAEPPQPKNWGIVYEQGTSRPVPQAILRIFEAKYNKLLETQVTDRHGRYHFRVGSNVYYVTVTKPGYLKTETDALDLTKVTEATVIASDLPLQKGGQQPPEKKPSALPPAGQPGYAPQAPKKSAIPSAPPPAVPQATAPPAPPSPPELPPELPKTEPPAAPSSAPVMDRPVAAPPAPPAQETPASPPPAPPPAAAPTPPAPPAAPEPPKPEPPAPPAEPKEQPPAAWFRDI